MEATLLTTEIRAEPDVVVARQRARHIASLLGFDVPQQTRIATAVSEVARNAFQYAGGGRVSFGVRYPGPRSLLTIQITDRGGGIGALEDILAGRYRSPTGMGLGLLGAKRLMDEFQVETGASGTRVFLAKALPATAPQLNPQLFARIADELSRAIAQAPSPMEEVGAQNAELIRALDELRETQEALAATRAELERAQDAVRALYAELEEASEAFEGAETETAHASDTARSRVTVEPFSVEELFAGLRAVFEPVTEAAGAVVRFDVGSSELPTMQADRARVAQLLRRVIAGAVKASARSDADAVVEVRAAWDGVRDELVFEVRAPEWSEAKGAEVVAHLLGGELQVEALAAVGARVRFRVPREHGFRPDPKPEPIPDPAPEPLPPSEPPGPPTKPAVGSDASLRAVVVITREDSTWAMYQALLGGSPFRAVRAFGPAAGREIVRDVDAAAVVVDGSLRDEALWTLLEELSERQHSGSLLVLVVGRSTDRERAEALVGRSFFAVGPVDREWLLTKLRRQLRDERPRKVLIIDDEERARRSLADALARVLPHSVIEADRGELGLDRARLERPELIFLDVRMPGLDGFAVLDALKGDPSTRDIPVVITASADVSEQERRRLALDAAAIIDRDEDGWEVLRALEQLGFVHAGESALHA